jgi:hypothetical protein
MADPRSEPPSADRVAALLGELTTRLTTHRSAYLALLELRLEANRRPELAAVLTATVRESFESSVGFHEAAGLPGGRDEVLVRYLALTGLTVERLTLPEAFSGYSDAQVVALLIDRILPG